MKTWNGTPQDCVEVKETPQKGAWSLQAITMGHQHQGMRGLRTLEARVGAYRRNNAICLHLPSAKGQVCSGTILDSHVT